MSHWENHSTTFNNSLAGWVGVWFKKPPMGSEGPPGIPPLSPNPTTLTLQFPYVCISIFRNPPGINQPLAVSQHSSVSVG